MLSLQFWSGQQRDEAATTHTGTSIIFYFIINVDKIYIHETNYKESDFMEAECNRSHISWCQNTPKWDSEDMLLDMPDVGKD